MIVKKLLLAALLTAGGAYAQTYDCRILFSFNTAGPSTSLPFDNRSTGCNFWTFDYQAAGLSALTITIQNADGSITPGTFGTFSGTVLTGLNPNTSTTKGQTTLSGFVSWLRVSFSGTASGTVLVNGVMYGYHSGFNPAVVPASGCVGTSATPCVVDGVTAAGSPPSTPPVLAAGQDGTNVRTLKTDSSGDPVVVGAAASGASKAGNPVQTGGVFNTTQPTVTNGQAVENQATARGAQIVAPGVDGFGVNGPAAIGAAASNPVQTGYRDDSGNVLADYGFPDQAQITLSAGTDVVVVAGVASTKTYVKHLSFAADSGQTVTIQQGTGTTCLTNTAVLFGPYQLTTALALDFDSKGPLHTTVNARDLCLHFGGSVTAGGGIVYGTH